MVCADVSDGGQGVQNLFSNIDFGHAKVLRYGTLGRIVLARLEPS